MTNHTTIPEQHKKCTSCNEIFPATLEYFSKKGTGFQSKCKACVRAYSREWYKRNREKRLQDIAQYKKEHQKETAERAHKYYERNKDKIADYHRQYYLKNKTRINRRNRLWYSANKSRVLDRTRKYYHQNKSLYVQYHRAWAAKNQDKLRAAEHRRRARELSAPGTHTKEDVELQYRMQNGRCWWCEKPVEKNYHVDHRIPLARGGDDSPGNLVISCPQCNQSKGAKLPHEWCGRLL